MYHISSISLIILWSNVTSHYHSGMLQKKFVWRTRSHPKDLPVWPFTYNKGCFLNLGAEISQQCMVNPFLPFLEKIITPSRTLGTEQQGCPCPWKWSMQLLFRQSQKSERFLASHYLHIHVVFFIPAHLTHLQQTQEESVVAQNQSTQILFGFICF